MLLFLSLVVATWPYLRDLRDLKSGCRLAKWGILIQVAHVAYQDLAGVNPAANGNPWSHRGLSSCSSMFRKVFF